MIISSRKRLDQSGALSLLTVVIFMIIISTITLAYISSVTRRQKDAFNYDLSTRAYYAAESGVQDAVRSLATNSSYQTSGKLDCPPADGGGVIGANSSYAVGYTCQMISVKNSVVKGSVVPNSKNAMVRLDTESNPAGPYKLVVRWSLKQTESGQQVLYPRGTDQPLFPPYDKWFAGENPARPIHAMLRVNVISVPKAGPFNRDQIRQRVVFMNPVTAENSAEAFGGGYVNFAINNDSIEPQQANLVNNTECHPSNTAGGVDYREYSCKRTIILGSGYNLANQTLYARVSSLYRETDFSIELTQNNNTPITIRNGQALIDVTGKAGDTVFRRVQQAVSIGGLIEDNQPDAALIAGEGICKLFSYTNLTSGYQEGCNPLAPNN